MPPRVAYWCSSFRPELEAVAAEVACLRRAFPGSVVWGVSGRDRPRLSWRRGFCVSPRWQWLFRGATRLAQSWFHLNHVFGSLGDWFHLKAVRRRPTVLTVALASPACDQRLLDKVDRFAVEWPAAKDRLQAMGIRPERVRLVYPPVDLQEFRPAPRPKDPFCVLFASSPDRADWLDARGMDLLLDAAALLREFRFRLVWRPWGDSLAEMQRRIEARGLANVELVVGRFAEMAEHYRAAHVTVAPFRDPERCKAAPNSLLESLACGRPVVVTRCVGLADVIDAARAGVVCDADPAGLATSLETIRGGWNAYAVRARQLAEATFGTERFVAAYQELYRELLA